MRKPKSPEPFKPSKESQELQRRQVEEQREQESEIAEREALKKKRTRGRQSLLTGAATGVEDRQNTLG